jgi:hypothetical protein
VDSYISDLRAANHAELNLRLYRMKKLGIPQERISERLGIQQRSVSNYLAKMPESAFLLNSELEKGFTVAQIAEKYGWPESMVWPLKLEDKDDLSKYQGLQWGLRSWDDWKWTDCNKRFGDEWPGRIPAQLLAHLLYYFSP